MTPSKPSIGWSNLALAHHKDPAARRFKGPPAALLTLVKKHWAGRQPGFGRKDLTHVIVVPIAELGLARLFKSTWLATEGASRIRGSVVRRQAHEDPFVSIEARGRALPVKHASVVLYARKVLEENNGTTSGPFDWEIVAVVSGPWENPPMDPLTMARNYLRKPGGTFANYTAKQFAEAIYFWSGFVRAAPG